MPALFPCYLRPVTRHQLSLNWLLLLREPTEMVFKSDGQFLVLKTSISLWLLKPNDIIVSFWLMTNAQNKNFEMQV